MSRKKIDIMQGIDWKDIEMLVGLLSNGVTIVEVVQKRLLVHSA